MSFFKNLNDNTKGLLSMLLGQLSFAINDTVVKYTVKLSETNFSVFNILFIRGIITCVLIYLIIIIIYRKQNRKIKFQKEFFYRGLFEVLTAFFFFIALILMPIANVYTLLMTTPLIVTATAAIFLREKVGVRRWTAVVIGFIGVIIVINPKNLEFGYLFILPIISAIFLTLRDIVTKNVANKNNSLSNQNIQAGLQERIHQVMNVAVTRELENIEKNIGFLATVGSTAPFIGLFGTVWGIMNSFQSIALSKDTSLAVVAPGIAEALLATALGLVAAIPAVIAYNKLSNNLNTYALRLQNFASEFEALLSRHLSEQNLEK